MTAAIPDLAYEPFVEGGRGRWRWDQARPQFIGEDFYATGIQPWIAVGGEVAFRGKATTRDAIALRYRMFDRGLPLGGRCRLALLGRRRRRQHSGVPAAEQALVRQVGLDIWRSRFRRWWVVQRHPVCEADDIHAQAHGGQREILARSSIPSGNPGMAEGFDEEIVLPRSREGRKGS